MTNVVNMMNEEGATGGGKRQAKGVDVISSGLRLMIL